MFIRILVDGKVRKVQVRDKECKDLNCLVPFSGNSPGEYSCRIRDVKGCPQNKLKEQRSK